MVIRRNLQVLLLVVASVLAQAMPARGQTLDAAFQSDIEALLDATGSAQMRQQVMILMNGQLLGALKKARPDVPDRVVEIAKEVLNSEFARAWEGPDGLKAQMVSIYAKHFTSEDVRGLLAFYRSDIGKKMVGLTPVLFQETMAAGQQWAERRMPSVSATLQARLIAEGLSTATAYRAVDGKLIGPPRKIKNVNPEFPENAQRAGLTGAVVLKCFIGTDGKVKDIQVISGYSSLAAAATKAVRQWEFTPTTLDGAPVPVEMTVATNFTLTGTGDLKLDDVVKATGDADPDIRLAAVTWLGSHRPAKDKQLKAIQALVRDPNPAVQAAATRALESLNVK